MANWNEAAVDFDNNTRQQNAVIDISMAQQAVNYLGEQLLRLRGASGVGFDILDSVVTQLNSFGSKKIPKLVKLSKRYRPPADQVQWE
jgi:hypothetical protein